MYSLYITSKRQVIFRKIVGKDVSSDKIDFALLYPLSDSKRKEIYNSNNLIWKYKRELVKDVIENIGHSSELARLLEDISIQKLIHCASNEKKEHFYISNNHGYFVLE